MTTWDDRISLAEESGIFSPEDRELANAWATCALGEIAQESGGYESRGSRADIRDTPMSASLTPHDDVLRALGLHFGHAVGTDDVHRARVFMSGIHSFMKGKRDEAWDALRAGQEGLSYSYADC